MHGYKWPINSTRTRTAGRLLVCDIQGKGDFWTDPAIHSADAMGFGAGNFGLDGCCAFFLNHQCSALCRELGLQPFALSAPEQAKLTAGTGSGQTTPAADSELALLRELSLPAATVVVAAGDSASDSSGVMIVDGKKGELAAACGRMHVKTALRYLRAIELLSSRASSTGAFPYNP